MNKHCKNTEKGYYLLLYLGTSYYESFRYLIAGKIFPKNMPLKRMSVQIIINLVTQKSFDKEYLELMFSAEYKIEMLQQTILFSEIN